MADVFISYASPDRARAKTLAEALGAKGWSVWWDRAIPPGRLFDEVIEEALDAASCAVVLWSSQSVASTWVRAEAAEALRRRILVPVLIEHVKIPLEFRRLQAADLSAWGGVLTDPQFAELCRSIRTLVGRGGVDLTQSSEVKSPPTERPRSARGTARSAQAQRPRALLHPRTVLPLAIGVVALLAAGAYVAYDEMQKVADEQQARVVMERDAEAARAAAQRQPEQERESAASRSATGAPAPHAQTATPRPAPEPQRAATQQASINIAGSWRDPTWGHVSQITQDGDAFEYTVWGTACLGKFRSSGTGSIRGMRLESTYRSTMPSQGRCSGTVSPDGTRITSTCVDSACGEFLASAVRQ
jgi:TIR domain